MGVLNLKLEFTGGPEILFDMQKMHDVAVPTSGSLSVADLLKYIYDNMIPKQRAHLLFNKEGTNVRPGVLVLINDTDWELYEGLQTLLKDGDVVSFLSALHGG